MKIERIELPEQLTEKTACEFVGHIAAVCSGKYPKSNEVAERIGRMNLTEDFSNQPTVAWEFLPVVTARSKFKNFREALKQNNPLAELAHHYTNDKGQKENREDFHIFKLTVPKMVRDHIVKHRTLSVMSSSKRLGVNNEVLYEFPEIEKDESTITDIIKTTTDINKNKMKSHFESNNGEYFYNNLTHFEFEYALKSYYNRKEIQKRSLSDFEVVEMMCVGYKDAWENFINVRTVTCNNSGVCPNLKCEKPCIQRETRWIAEQIREGLK